jgi:exodeoxyribonuclease X
MELLAQFAQDRDLDIRFSAQTKLTRRGETREQSAATPAQQTLF